MRVVRNTNPTNGDYVTFEELEPGEAFYPSNLLLNSPVHAIRIKLDTADKYCDPNDGQVMDRHYLGGMLLRRARAKIVVED